MSAFVSTLLLELDFDNREIPVSYPLLLFFDCSSVLPLLDVCCCCCEADFDDEKVILKKLLNVLCSEAEVAYGFLVFCFDFLFFIFFFS